MKRFHFRLDRVLQLRESAEADAAREVATAQLAAERATAQAGAAERALLHAVAQTAASAQGETVGVLNAMRLSLDAARERVTEASAVRVQAEAVVEQQLDRWRSARAERQALEKLRTQRKDAWTVDANRAEQADIDEVALRRRLGLGEHA